MAAERHDILELEDVKLLVNSFYSKARKNELLGPIFEETIKDNWDHHLDKMVRFWETILLEAYTYSGNPLLHHLPLPIDETHFSQWLVLFRETVNEHFSGEKARVAIDRAEKMKLVLESKIKQFKAGQ